MKIKKQASPFCNMSDEQLIFFCFDNFDYQVKMDSPKDKSIFESSKGVFTYNKHFYKHCFSRKVVKHGYNTRELYTKDGDKIHVKVQRY